MSSQMSPQLSKSRFVAGLQCLKRLYLECNHRDLADPIEPRQQTIFETGTAIGELARQRFPGGRLISEPFFEHSQAVSSTQHFLTDTSVPALYEAAFTFEGIRTRVDILRQSGQRKFDLIEVKSNTSVKAEHIGDIAIQLHVVEGSGIQVRNAYLMHINNTYVYQGGPHKLEELFSLQDVTEVAQAYVSENIENDLARMWELLQQDQMPSIDTGPHCSTPYRCPFYGHCNQKDTEHPIEELPRLGKEVLEKLTSLEIGDIGKIPSGFSGLTPTQKRVRDCVIKKQSFVSPYLSSRLEEIRSPECHLDFETFNPALPAYVGTKPYQIIPFQWSLHIRDSSGQLNHRWFLNEDAEDPRERFVTTLLDVIPPEGSIVVYSGYELTVMRQLALAFPQYADRLKGLCERTFDLLKLIRESFYHPEFHGSYSIKSVLPALVPDLSYADLEIREGSTAAIAYPAMIASETPESDKSKTKEALLAYCQRDTEAMVRILDVLIAESSNQGGFD